MPGTWRRRRRRRLRRVCTCLASYALQIRNWPKAEKKKTIWYLPLSTRDIRANRNRRSEVGKDIIGDSKEPNLSKLLTRPVFVISIFSPQSGCVIVSLCDCNPVCGIFVALGEVQLYKLLLFMFHNNCQLVKATVEYCIYHFTDWLSFIHYGILATKEAYYEKVFTYISSGCRLLI